MPSGIGADIAQALLSIFARGIPVMKCRPEEMTLFKLDYGDLLRPTYRILPSRGWGQCTNLTSEFLIIYGPKNEYEQSIFDTSPYALPPGRTTPDRWDCDGFFLPSDRVIQRWGGSKNGPLAIKFWNHRRFSVRNGADKTYRASWDNGIFLPSQINWAIPNFTYRDILGRLGIPK